MSQAISNPLAPERKGMALVRHEDVADMMIAHPGIKRADLAKMVGYTPEYISMITCSDAFQAILARRKAETVDPLIREELDARFKAITQRSLEIVQEKLAAPAFSVSDALVLKAMELGAKGAMLGGFAPAVQVAAPTLPAGDRLDRLAGRLEALIPDRRAGAVDVVVREVAP